MPNRAKPQKYDDDPAVQRILALQKATGYHMEECRPPTKLHWRILHLYFDALSMSATGIVFILLFPFWFALGHPNVTVHLCMCMTFAQLFTSIIKDIMRVPRPPSPPVVQIGAAHYAKECSLPSGHSSGALLLSYVNASMINEIYFPNEHQQTIVWIINCVGFVYYTQVMVSRVYLGMHFIQDCTYGSLVGLFIAVVHGVLGGDRMLDALLASTSSSWFPLIAVTTIAVAVSFIAFHPPSPAGGQNSYLDSARFVGAGLGAILGVWMSRSAESNYFIPSSSSSSKNWYAEPAVTWAETIGLTVLFVLQMVVVETIIKMLMEKFILPMFVFDKNSMTKNHVSKVYVWSRFISHVAFSATLLFGAPYLRSVLEMMW